MMISFEQALATMLESAVYLGCEETPLSEAVGHVLAEDVASDLDMPPFNKSAMDGYACRRADLAQALTVIETIQAGSAPQQPIGPSQCAKIMTGAPVPEGADCVIMVEYTEETSPGQVRFTGKDTRDNICQRGEDIQRGQRVLEAGARIEPQHIAVLASVGCTAPAVARRPRVAVISTGNEIVEPGAFPSPSQIRDSNSHQLCAQIAKAGAVPNNMGIVRDTEEAIDAALRGALAENDLVLLSGGVSMGDFDLVPPVMEANGIRILFNAIAMKPGKPTTFGVGQGKYILGLPGNPVSTFVQFELIVKPFLFKLMGADFRAQDVLLPLGRTLTRKKTRRLSWLPVTITDEGKAMPGAYHGSAHIHAMCGADGLISIPVGVAEVPEGTLVRVRLI